MLPATGNWIQLYIFVFTCEYRCSVVGFNSNKQNAYDGTIPVSRWTRNGRCSDWEALLKRAHIITRIPSLLLLSEYLNKHKTCGTHCRSDGANVHSPWWTNGYLNAPAADSTDIYGERSIVYVCMCERCIFMYILGMYSWFYDPGHWEFWIRKKRKSDRCKNVISHKSDFIYLCYEVMSLPCFSCQKCQRLDVRWCDLWVNY